MVTPPKGNWTVYVDHIQAVLRAYSIRHHSSCWLAAMSPVSQTLTQEHGQWQSVSIPLTNGKVTSIGEYSAVCLFTVTNIHSDAHVVKCRLWRLFSMPTCYYTDAGTICPQTSSKGHIGASNNCWGDGIFQFISSTCRCLIFTDAVHFASFTPFRLQR